MSRNTYSVYVNAIRAISGNEYQEEIKFFSEYAARYMAKEYYNCIDVYAVKVVDNSIGELIYYHNPQEEYDNN